MCSLFSIDEFLPETIKLGGESVFFSMKRDMILIGLKHIYKLYSRMVFNICTVNSSIL